jgi:prevent-host-death family protein
MSRSAKSESNKLKDHVEVTPLQRRMTQTGACANALIAAAAAATSPLHCSPMATKVPQRELRNNTASLLRRVEAGERLCITVHGHPVAELVPLERTQGFVPFDELVNELRGTMLPDDRLDYELRELDEPPRDPFA